MTGLILEWCVAISAITLTVLIIGWAIALIVNWIKWGM